VRIDVSQQGGNERTLSTKQVYFTGIFREA